MGNGFVPVTVAALIPAGLSFGIVNAAVRSAPGALSDAAAPGRLIVTIDAATCVPVILAYPYPWALVSTYLRWGLGFTEAPSAAPTACANVTPFVLIAPSNVPAAV